MTIQTTSHSQLDISTDLRQLNHSHFQRRRDLRSLGCIETPNDLAVVMVLESLTAVSDRKPKDLRWLDPCSGTGAFPLALITVCGESGSIQEYEDLPRLTLIEIDEDATDLLRLRIDDLLGHFGLNFDGYVQSGRLVIQNADFFALLGRSESDTPLSAGFDVIIGNPPYVQSRLIPSSTRENIRGSWLKELYTATDLYVWFYAAAASLLSKDGVICFVTPHNFLKAQSSRMVRQLLSRMCRLVKVIDLGERPIFSGANVHSGVFVLKKSEGVSHFTLLDLSNAEGEFLRSETDIALAIDASLEVSGDAKWVFHHMKTDLQPRPASILTLESCGFQIFSGIRTGLADAYVLDQESVSELSLQDDPSVAPLLSPMDIGEEIRAQPTKWIINVPDGCEEPSRAVVSHLAKFRDGLINRPEAKGLTNWYNQRTLKYLDVMSMSKICFPDICRSPRFAIVESGVLVADGAYFVNSDDPALLAILRSRETRRFLECHAPTIGAVSARGRLRLKKHVVKQVPLPPAWLLDDGRLDSVRQLMKTLLDSESLDTEIWRHIENSVSQMFQDN